MDGNGMKRLIFSAALIPAVLVGCNDTGNGNSNDNSLGAPSFVISSSNRAQVDQVAGSTAAESSTETYIGDGSGRSLLLDPSYFTNQVRTFASRATTEAIECSDGSGTVSGSVTGVDENGEAEASGSISIDMSYDECKQATSSDNYVLHDGSQGLDIEWSGYNASMDVFESLSVTASFDTYHNETVVDGEVENDSTVEGSLTLSATQTEYRASFSLAMSSSEIDNKVIAMETTADIVRGVSDTYPTSGVIVVTGGEDTQAVYTIVANGIEVSLNGGQAELIAWSEIETEDGSF